jgi:hypothetical protein
MELPSEESEFDEDYNSEDGGESMDVDDEEEDGTPKQKSKGEKKKIKK